MIYAKVDVVLPRHHRMQAIDRASAFGVYVAALCHTREHELDGFVPMVAFRGFPSHSKSDVDELVRVGLFELVTVDGLKGVQIAKYEEKNETKADVADRRTATRERVTRFREKGNGVTEALVTDPCNAVVPGSGSVFGSVPSPEGIQGGRANAFGMELGAYASGIAAGTGRPCAKLNRFALEPITACIEAFAPKGLNAEQLLAWVTDSAKAYAIATKAAPQFQAGYHPRKWVDWLNAGKPVTQAIGSNGKPDTGGTPYLRGKPPPEATGPLVDPSSALATVADIFKPRRIPA